MQTTFQRRYGLLYPDGSVTQVDAKNIGEAQQYLEATTDLVDPGGSNEFYAATQLVAVGVKVQNGDWTVLDPERGTEPTEVELGFRPVGRPPKPKEPVAA